MHQYTINVSTDFTCRCRTGTHMNWVDEAIAIIQQSGVKRRNRSFATVLEGTYSEVMRK